MVALVISFLYLIFISIITGHVVSKKLGFSPTWIEKALLGIALCNSLFSLISLFSPIKPYISLLYFIICIIFFLLDYKNIFSFSIPRFKPKNLFFLTYPVIIIFGFINSLYSPIIFDSGLYHIQAIEWIENYPVVPGLVNLHDRFGFNPNIFVLFAATSFDGIFKNEVYSVNFVIYCLVSVWLLRGIYKFFQLRHYYLGIIFLVVLIMLLNSSSNLSSPTPDFACYFIPFFIFLRFIEIKILDKSNNLSQYFTVITLAIYVITVKLAALSVLLIIPLIFYQNWKIISKKDLYVISFLTFIIMVPWLVRNIILTGWIIYPFAGIDLFTFDWKVPKSEVISMTQTITGWGRNPGNNFMEAAHMSFNQWFPIWWSAQSQFKRILFIIISSSPLIILILIFLQKLKAIMKSYQPVYFIAFAGFVFWFSVSPDWRYALPWIVLPLVSPLLFIKYSINLKSKYLISMFSILIIAYTIYLNLTSIVDYLNVTSVDYLLENFDRVKYVTPKIIGTNENGKVKFKTYTIDKKLKVKYPVNDYRCFDEEIPCSPYLKGEIYLRGDDLRSGFYKH